MILFRARGVGIVCRNRAVVFCVPGGVVFDLGMDGEMEGLLSFVATLSSSFRGRNSSIVLGKR